VAEELPGSVRVTIELRPQRDDLAVVHFEPGRVLHLSVSADLTAGHRRDMIMNRLFSVLPLLGAAKDRYATVVGRCALWLDDFPGGPGLCFSGNAVDHVLIPDSEFVATNAYEALRSAAARSWVPYGEREDKVFWRGTSTGDRRLLRQPSWRAIPRFALALLVQQLDRPDLLDVALSGIVQIAHPQEMAEIQSECSVAAYSPPITFMNYKYCIDIDGNTSSWAGLFSRLLMANTVVKVSSVVGFRQWYYDRLVPWHNFVPVSSDLRDLVEVAEWLVASPAQAEEIAMRGLSLADELTLENVIPEACARVAQAVESDKFLGANMAWASSSRRTTSG
jgi:hypothetical protein